MMSVCFVWYEEYLSVHNDNACQGLAAVAKVLLAMEEGTIPANLHYSTANPDIPALTDGRLKVVSENTSWNGGYVGVNSFGFGGSNVHVLLRSTVSKENAANGTSDNDLGKRLVTVSGRTEEGVELLLNVVAQRPHDAGLHALLHDLATVSPAVHAVRGFTVTGTARPTREIAVSIGTLS